MAATVLNSVQQHLLKVFAFDGSEDRLNEVKEVLTKNFSQRLDGRLNDLWDSGGIKRSLMN